MKSIILTLCLLAAGSMVCFAQCDKKVNLTSTKTEYLNASGMVDRTVDEDTEVQIGKSDVTVIINKGDKQMSGAIKSSTCDWKTPYKEGKTVINTTLYDPNGNGVDFTITIEGREGKLILLAESKQMPDKKIRLPLDKFEEKN
jgi:hypothetical protein